MMNETTNENVAHEAGRANQIASILRVNRGGGVYSFTAQLGDGTELVLRKSATRRYEWGRIYDNGAGMPESATLHLKRPSIWGNATRLVRVTGASATNETAGTNEGLTTNEPEQTNEGLTTNKKTDSAPVELAQSFATAMPEYVASNGEVEHLRLAINAGENALLTGPTGCGKTHLVMWLAKEMGREVVTIQGGDGMTPEHMIGYRDIVRSGETSITTWRDGLLTQAMRNGSLLYVDEPNALPEGIRFYLFSAMDMRREVTLAENGGEVVRAAKGFTVVAAMNEGAGYTGTSMLNYAFRGRFIVIDVDYLPPAREAKLLHSRSGAPEAHCKTLAKVAQSLRAAQAQKAIKTPIGTRSLLSCAKFIAMGVDPRTAGELAIVTQAPAHMVAERKAMSDMIVAHFAQG
jgi:nitric oxide reductase NorQ protein